MPVSFTAIEHPEAGRTEVTGLTVFPGLVRFPYAEHSPRDGGRSVGHPHPAKTPVLGPFVEQPTVLLTSYRKNGRPVPTPVSIADDGDRAVVRSFEKAGKTRRLRNDASVAVAPCSWRGTHRAGDSCNGSVPGWRRVAPCCPPSAPQVPLLHGFVVPLAHRVGRRKTGPTVHFEPIPEGLS